MSLALMTAMRRWWAGRRASLAARITAIAMLPVLVLTVLVGGTAIEMRHSDLDAALRKQGLLLARMMATAGDYGVFSGNLAALQSLTDSTSQEPAVVLAAVLARDQTILAISASGAKGPAQPRLGDPLPSALSSEILEFRQTIGGNRIAIDDVESDRRELAPDSPVAVVRVSSRAVRQETEQFALLVIAMLLGVLIAAGVVARQMSRRISRPLAEVAQAVEKVGQGEMGVQVQTSPITVLARLAYGVNDMAGRLELARRTLEARVLEATRLLTARTEDAERANLAKSRFLAAASHDLRQPMHALGMFVAALREQSLNPSQRELTDRIDQSVGALGELLDSLLDVSKLDAGVIEPRTGPVRLQDVFERTRNAFSGVAKARALALVVRRTPVWVVTDRLLLERVLNNLVSNALRYTEAGAVMVAARITGAQRDRIRIEVRDSGPGIAPESHELIFEEFVQLGNPERDRGKGLGLGLAIVRRLSALLAHPLRLRSQPGKGSVFSLELPRLAPTAGTAANPDAGLGPGREGQVASPAAFVPEQGDPIPGAKILVIDDDGMVRDAVTQLLTAWGADVIALNAQPDLTNLLAVRPLPDVILCDLRLTDGLSGVDVLATLRRLVNRPIPAVLITGDTDPERISLARDSGDPVIYKPLRPAQLRALLHALLRAGRA